MINAKSGSILSKKLSKRIIFKSINRYSKVKHIKHAILRAATHSRVRTQWELGWQAELAQLMGAMDVLLAGAMPSIGGHQSGPENNLGPLTSTTGSAA